MHVCECACGRQREYGGKSWGGGWGGGGVDGPLECKHRDIPAIKYLSSENHSPEEMVMI